jgi:hypothetical protein
VSSTAWVVVLATVGFLAEVGGVGLIVFDIRESREQARRIVGRGQTIRLESARAEERALPIHVRGGKQPSLEERLDGLEGRYRELDERLTTELGALRRELQTDASERAREVEEIARADYAVVSSVLRDMLAGSLGRRIWGVALVLLGLAASFAANLVSALATG